MEMKNKYYIIIAIFFLSITVSHSQVRIVNTASNTAAPSSSAFIDASSSLSNNSSTNRGKGLLYPRVNLTTFTAFGGSPHGLSTSYPSRFDGLVVYNTATSGVAGVGATDGTLSKGFWYYDNPTATGGAPNNVTSLNAGTWRPLGGGGGGGAVAVDDDTPTDSDLIINSNQEKVVRLTGTANGVSTHIDLGTTTLAANTVSTFRKAVVYDATSGHVILESTGAYDPATNVFVTGNGMMNVLLDTGAYDVELYYTE